MTISSIFREAYPGWNPWYAAANFGLQLLFGFTFVAALCANVILWGAQ